MRGSASRGGGEAVRRWPRRLVDSAAPWRSRRWVCEKRRGRLGDFSRALGQNPRVTMSRTGSVSCAGFAHTAHKPDLIFVFCDFRRPPPATNPSLFPKTKRRGAWGQCGKESRRENLTANLELSRDSFTSAGGKSPTPPCRSRAGRSRDLSPARHCPLSLARRIARPGADRSTNTSQDRTNYP